MENVTYTMILTAGDTGTEGCNSDFSLRYGHCCPLCSGEPHGAWGGPENYVGRAVLFFMWGIATG